VQADVHFINSNLGIKENIHICSSKKWKPKYLSVMNIAHYLFLKTEKEKIVMRTKEP